MQTTKDRILQSVIEFIKEPDNLEQITLSKIAKKAGIGKSTVYEHFSSKEAIIIETYKHLLKHYEQILIEPLVTETFKSQFIEQLEKILYVMKDARKIMETLLSQSEHAFSNIHKDIQIHAKHIQQQMNLRFESIFTKAIKEGIITSKTDHPHKGRVVQAIISGLLYQYVNEDFVIDQDSLFKLIYDNIIVVLNASSPR
jgi:AcrR family transcriptional regulator